MHIDQLLLILENTAHCLEWADKAARAGEEQETRYQIGRARQRVDDLLKDVRNRGIHDQYDQFIYPKSNQPIYPTKEG